jgi:hypothetical protein
LFLSFPPYYFRLFCFFFPLAVVTCESADLVQESKKNHPWLLPVGNKNSSAKSDCFDDCPVRRYSPRGSALAQPSNLARRSSCAASSVLMTVEVLYYFLNRILSEIEIVVCLKQDGSIPN